MPRPGLVRRQQEGALTRGLVRELPPPCPEGACWRREDEMAEGSPRAPAPDTHGLKSETVSLWTQEGSCNS